MISLSIQAESSEEFQKQLAVFIHKALKEGVEIPRDKIVASTPSPLASAPPPPSINAAPSEPPVALPETTATTMKKRGRKPKIAAVSDVFPDDDGSEFEATAESPVKGEEAEEKDVISASALKAIPSPSSEDVIRALQEVNSNLGLPKARGLLQQFGCVRISEVPTAKYDEFIKVCKKELSSKAG